MELEIVESIASLESEKIEEPEKRINVQIFKIENLKESLEYIKKTCIIPLMRKADFETVEQLMICYRIILASFETLIIGQEVISKLETSSKN